MTQVKVKFSSFEEYLAWSDNPENYMEGRFEWVDGELMEVPPESGPNSAIANRILFLLVFTGIVPLELVYPALLIVAMKFVLGGALRAPPKTNFIARLSNAVYPNQCEVQVPVLQPKDPANRYADLVILDEVHIALTQKRLTITLDMPPPRLVAEVMSPGKQNRERDLIRKRDQYAARGIPEYWLIDPKAQTVTVLQLRDGVYTEGKEFRGSNCIISPTFPSLQLTVDQVFGVGN